MKAVGIILAGGSNERRLGALTSMRATSAMPVGSCYRAIDFALSNMSNSGINKVAVITQYNSRSLHDHLTSSKWWDFGRKNGGLFVFAPFISNDNSFWFRGTADSIYQNISFLKRSNEKYVIIASGDGIYKMDYRKLLEFHVEKEAEVTIAYKDLAGKDLGKYGILELDSDDRIIDLEEKPIEPQSSLASLGVYVMNRELLIQSLEEIVNDGRHDLVKDLFIRYRKRLRMYGYRFDGYWNTIGTGIKDYYDTNMDFLNKEVRDNFIKKYPFVLTKAKDEPPVKFNSNANVTDTLAGNGTILNGTVDHSVLFRKVFIGDNSVVLNSIIMENCMIGNNCRIENAILDKGVKVSDGVEIIGSTDNPVIIKKGTVL